MAFLSVFVLSPLPVDAMLETPALQDDRRAIEPQTDDSRLTTFMQTRMIAGWKPGRLTWPSKALS
ncbi:MAG: hypothetical protein ACOY3P_05030 [Planctomycetota bacterium]